MNILLMNIFLHNHKITIKIRKLTLIHYYHNFAKCLNNVFLVKGSSSKFHFVLVVMAL